MNFRHQAIIDIFTSFTEKGLKVWLSGERRNGVFMKWYKTGQLHIRSSWKDGERDGERKAWFHNGELAIHTIWKEGKKIKEIK